MHYKNGRLAKIGDPVVGPGYSGVVAGTVVDVLPGSSSCNLYVSAAGLYNSNLGDTIWPAIFVASKRDGKINLLLPTIHTVTAGEFMHAEDLRALFEIAEVARVAAENFKAAQSSVVSTSA